MAVSIPSGTFISTASPSNTTPSLSLTVPTNAQAGDILVICAASERTEIPVLRLNNATTGITIIRSEGTTNITGVFAWKRLVASDLGGTVTMTTSVNHRQSLSLLILRGAADPTFVNQAFSAAATGVATKTGPGFTPSADNAVAVELWAIARPISPYTGYSFTTATPWVERTEATSGYTTNINATTYTTSRLLATGTAGIAQTGQPITATSAPFDSMASVLVFTAATVTANPQANIDIKQPMAVIDCTASIAVNGGALTYSISPSVGVIEHTDGYFAVPQTTVPQVFNVTITETGGGSTTTAVTVPALSSASTGSGTGGTGTGVEIVRWHSGGWV